MKHHEDMQVRHRGHGSRASYVFGFLFSILLTLSAFSVAINPQLLRNVKISMIVWLGVMQLIVQLLFFLHVGSEPRSRPRWQLISFVFAVLILLIIVCGSLWIMYNLNYNMMPSEMLDAKIIADEAFDHTSH